MGKNLVAKFKVSKKNNVFEYDASSSIDDLYCYAGKCDFVIHLAGVNRAENPDDYVKGNVDFTRTLLEALETAENKVPVLLSSSKHVAYDTVYGRSKKMGEELVVDYSKRNNIKSYVYRLTNVFGKGSRPNHNGVVGTFCYNIAHDLPITVNDRSTVLELVYIDDLVDEFINATCSKENRIDDTLCTIAQSYVVSLGEIVDLIYKFKNEDVNLKLGALQGFEKAMYDTYLSYLSAEVVN